MGTAGVNRMSGGGSAVSRQYHEPVEVQVGEPVGGRLEESAIRLGIGDTVPTAFLWHGRVHVVRAVVDHWTQRLPWWRRAWEDTALTETGVSVLEHTVWRVEATAGRSAGAGVYDLVEGEGWQLVRVAD